MGVQVRLAIFGVMAGIVIASGVVAFMISLGLIPRYAGITRTAERVRLYEECAMWGAFLGNLFYLYEGEVLLGNWGLLIYGTFSGIFLGSWIIALGEIVDIFSIMVRRIGLTRGLGLVILIMALGKTLGSLWMFQKGW